MKPGAGLMKHYLQFKDLRAEEYAYLFERARIIKTRFKNYERYQPLTDRTLAMIFEKASTRTRVSFEAGMYQMGGSVVHLTTGDSHLGRAEPVEDTARVISRMVDIVMIRTYEQAKIAAFAAHSRVPVINGLTNEYHPCQILADIFTFIEHRGARGGEGNALDCLKGKVVAWVGDGNNMPTPGCRQPISWASRCMSARPAATRSTPRWRAFRGATATRFSTARWTPAAAPTW
jgi:ornithine carbamoyltransferase